MKVIRTLARSLLAAVIVLFVFEWIIEWLMSRKHEEWSQQIKPVYSWSTYSGNGVRLGEKKGILKLVLRPYITYGSMPNQRTQYFTINSRGYRGEEVAIKNPSKRRIVIVGGSAAFGSGLDSDSDTFAYMLTKLGDFEVINAAVIGHQSGQELSYLIHELIDLEPDILIAFDGWNDFMQSKWKRELSQVGDVGFAQVEGQLEDYSKLTQDSPLNRIGNSFPIIIFPALWRGISIGVRNISEGEQDLPQASSEIVTSFIRDHILMNDIMTAKSGKLIVALQPDRRAIEVKRGMQQRDNKTKIIGERYLAFSEQISAQLSLKQVKTINFNTIDSELSGDHFFDEVHLNHAGNKIVAKVLLEYQ